MLSRGPMLRVFNTGLFSVILSKTYFLPSFWALENIQIIKHQVFFKNHMMLCLKKNHQFFFGGVGLFSLYYLSLKTSKVEQKLPFMPSLGPTKRKKGSNFQKKIIMLNRVPLLQSKLCQMRSWCTSM